MTIPPQNLEAFVDTDVAALFRAAKDGRLVSANLAAARILGYESTDAVLEADMRGIWVDPGLRAAFLGDIAKAGQVSGREIQLVRRDGSQLWVLISAKAVHDESGEMVAFDGVAVDITAQKTTEAELRGLESRYRDLVEQTPAVTFVDKLDDRATMVYVSPQIEDLLGYTPEEWLKLDAESEWVGPIHPDDRSRAWAEYMAGREKGDSWSLEYRIQHRDGAWLWIREEAKVVHDDGGHPQAVQGLYQDVTARREAEEKLKQRDKIMETVAFAAGRFLKNASWTDSINDVLERLGKTVDASSAYLFENVPLPDGRMAMDLTFEWDAPGIARGMDDPGNRRFPYDEGFARWQSLLSSGGGIFGATDDFEGPELEAMHTEDILSLAVVPVFTGDHWWGYIGVDDCERKRPWTTGEIEALRAIAAALGSAIEREAKEDSLRNAEAKYRALIERIPAAITYVSSVDVVDEVLYISPQAESVLGYSADEWLEHPDLWVRMIHPDDVGRVSAEAERTATTFDPFDEEYRIVTRGERIVWLRDRSSVVRDDNGNPLFWLGVMVDTTSNHESMDALAAAEERYRTLVEQIPAVVYIDIPGTGFTSTYIAPQVESLLGITPEEWTSDPTTWERHVHPDDREAAVREGKKAEREGGTHVGEYRIVRPDERIVWIRDEFTTLLDEQGNPRLVQGVMFDITELKEAGASLQLYRAIVESSTDAIFSADLKGKIQSWNPGSTRLYGYSAEEAVGSDLSILAPPGRELEMLANREVIWRGGSISNQETQRLAKDGRLVDVSVTISPVRDAEGKVVGASGITRDITEQVAADAQLSYQAGLLRNVNDAIIATDEDYRLTAWNRAAELTYGWSAEEVLGKQMNEILRTEIIEGKDTDGLVAAAETGQWRGEMIQYHRSGKPMHIEARGIPLYDVEGTVTGYVTVNRDITERRRAEEVARSATLAEEAAAQANKAKSDFLSRMSHELRTPLNAILGFAQLTALDDLTPEQAQNINHIVTGGEHLLNLINEVLDISRIEVDRLGLAAEPVRLSQVVDEAIEMLGYIASDRGIEIDAPDATEMLLGVMADHQRLKQVLLNLLSNAVKYNSPNGFVHVSAAELPDGETIRLSVSDTGKGIPEERLRDVFSPFDRLGAEQSEIEGTGLGLALSKRLIEAMGGAIGVDSKIGEGSTFWIELPVAHVVGESQSAPAPEGAISVPGPFGPCRVLYIEDNLSNLRLVERVLSRRPNIKLISAMQGRLGFDLAVEHRPDLVLLDVHLPDISGEKVLKLIQDNPVTAEIPVVVISADATKSQMTKMLAQGATEYLAKPFDVARLLEIVDEAAGPVPGTNLTRRSAT